MSRTKKTATQPRRRHTPEFKVEALALAEQIGAVDAASQLKVKASQ
jgi:transposase-like protein